MADLKQITTVINEMLLLDLSDEFQDAPIGEVAGVLRAGRLQDDPEAAHTSITLHVGDPDDPEAWKDTSYARRDHALDHSQFEAQTWEIGGGSTFWRRGVVKWEFFGTLTGESRIEAERKAGVIQARIERAVAKSRRVPGCRDDFGEQAIIIMRVVSHRSEGGGPPDQFIWRGAVLWQCLCASPY